MDSSVLVARALAQQATPKVVVVDQPLHWLRRMNLQQHL
jgi:ABC-type cobalamin/Fe3+-siderophores transport system ATPase subunit